MNYSLIAQITLFLSSIGLGFIVYGKISILSGLSEVITTNKNDDFLIKIKEGVKISNPLEDIRYEDFLAKVLKKIRMFFLVTDNKIFSWSQKLKNESQKHKIEDDKDYWDRIKNDSSK